MSVVDNGRKSVRRDKDSGRGSGEFRETCPAVSVYRNRSLISEAYIILKSVYCKGIFEINGKRIVMAYSVGCKRKC